MRALYCFLIIFSMFFHTSLWAGSTCDLLVRKFLSPLQLKYSNRGLYIHARYQKINIALYKGQISYDQAYSLSKTVAEEELSHLGVDVGKLKTLQLEPHLYLSKEAAPKRALFKITADDLPVAKQFSQDALTHPEMKSYLEDLESRGYSLVIDHTIALDDHMVLGFMHGESKTIALMPNATWEVFRHEYRHVLTKELLDSIPDLKGGVKTISQLEMKNLEKIDCLGQIGYSRTTLSEYLSVQDEIKALKELGYGPLSSKVYEARGYDWAQRLNDLKSISWQHMTSAQKTDLLKIRVQQVTLNPFLRRLILVSAGAFLGVYYHKELQRFVIKLKEGEYALFEWD